MPKDAVAMTSEKKGSKEEGKSKMRRRKKTLAWGARPLNENKEVPTKILLKGSGSRHVKPTPISATAAKAARLR